MRERMNLEELSAYLQMPKEELTAWLEEHLHVILLSETAPLAVSTLETVLSYFYGTEEETEEQKAPPAPLPSPDEEETVQFMKDCIERNFLIMADTCSIMGDVQNQFSSFFPFLNRIAPLLRQHNKKIIVPFIVYSEITWFRENVPRSARGKQASRILPKIDSLVHEGLLVIIGGREDWPRSVEKPFADDCLCEKVSRMRTNGRNVLVITQDKNLTADLKAILTKKSVTSDTDILVRKLGKKKGLLLDPCSAKSRKE